MSRKGRALRNARPAGLGAGPPISKVRGPADVAVIIPYLLGFQPAESLVLVALEGPRKRFGPVLRVDLVDDPDLRPELTAQVVGLAVSNHVPLALVVAFSDTSERADPLVGLVVESLAEHGVGLEDAFRTDGRRWWSYVCHDPQCCNPDGVPYDAGTSRVAAEAVVSGLSFVPDREALRSRFLPEDAGLREEVGLEARFLRRTDPSVWPWSSSVPLEAKVTSALAAPSALTTREAAWLAVAVQPWAGQERAIALIDRANAAQHFELWRTVMCRVPDHLLPAVGCLAAFSAWLDGRGVLASHAVDKVLEVAPSHPFARSVATMLAQAVNPRTWPERRERRDYEGQRQPPAS